jgi:signal transduction histidine kinase
MSGQLPSGAAMAARGGRYRFACRKEPGCAGASSWRQALKALAASCAPAALASRAHAQVHAAPAISTVDVIQIAVFTGAMGAALILAVWMIRERAHVAAENAALRERIADLHATLGRADALVNLRNQRVAVWAAGRKPETVGALPPESGAPEDTAGFLSFGRWLNVRSAVALERAVAALRDGAGGFDLIVESQAGYPLEAQGRRGASQVLVQFTALSEARAAEARLRLENAELQAERGRILRLLDALPMPVWLRNRDGALAWVNDAYARAVEAPDRAVVLHGGREFLGSQAREAIRREQAARPVFSGEVSTVVGGDRQVFAVTDAAGPDGAAGIAVDATALASLREESERAARAHADTLDQLSTAVAIFDAGTKLRFFNQAFQSLWNLDEPFLRSAPDNALLLDRLRSEGKIAEQPEWRRWKEELLSAYRATESRDQWWHLPDGRTLRVVTSPQPTGGVTWLFENVTERMNLESRYETAVRVQTETLDNLAEGVAVFGPDGRAKLSNPAFNALWGLDGDAAQDGTHVSALKSRCDARVKGGAAESPWAAFVAAVTGFDEERRDRSGDCELSDGTVLRYALINLPNGQVMLTFVDVSDTARVARALLEKNEALEKADQLKNEFVQHVSYELRSPLTNIIGFTELLSLPGAGPLSKKQREYVEHIGSSSNVLLTVINDILDLATVDAGIMQLEIADVAVAPTMDAAAELVADRFAEHGIRLQLDASAAPRAIAGDAVRIRQILYNLLSNAVNYAPEASTVALSCRSVRAPAPGVEFAVHDDGPGMPPDVLDTVFRRFEPRANGGRRRGAGLGLSIVKSFVELHGGTVRIETGEREGTTVTCFIPERPPAEAGGERDAAE